MLPRVTKASPQRPPTHAEHRRSAPERARARRARRWSAGWALALCALGCASTPTGTRGELEKAPAAEAATSSARVAVELAPAPDEAPAPPGLSLESLVVCFDDPRLPGLRAKVDAGAWLEAARLLEAAAATSETDPADERAERWHAAAQLRRRGGDPAGAQRAFERAHGLSAAISPVSGLFAAELAIELGRAAQAATLLAGVDEAVVERRRLARAWLRAELARAELDAARRRWAPLLTEPRRDRAWGEDLLLVARALLRSPKTEHVEEALELLELVRYASPLAAQAALAKKLSLEATRRVTHAKRGAYERPDAARRLARAEQLVGASRLREAATELDALVKQQPTLDAPATCRLGVARVRALGGVKRLGEAADVAARTVALCAGEELEPTITFLAGTAHARAKRHAEAERWFAEVETRFPSHTLADDAALEAARSALARGDLQAAELRLAKVAERYPRGDTVGDALFLLGTASLERGEAQRALGPFELGRARPVERAWHRAGRFDYFAARALDELGRGRDAEALYRGALERAPGSYYAALALARLGSGRPAEAKRALEAHLARLPSSAPPRLEASVAREPAWAAALAATRAGDPEGLSVALDAIGVSARTASEAGLYAAAELYARAGDAAAAHRVLRTASEIEPGGARLEAWSMRDAGPRGDYRRAWELAYPRAHAEAARFAATEAGIPPSLVFAIAREESAFDPKAVSRSDARGLMQLLPVTGDRMARGLGLRLDGESLFDPAINTRLGARFLAQMRRRFSPAEVLAIPGYNAGPGAPARWLEERPGMAFDLWVEAIPYAETRGYTKRVISSLYVYELLSGGDPAETLALPLVLEAPAER